MDIHFNTNPIFRRHFSRRDGKRCYKMQMNTNFGYPRGNLECVLRNENTRASSEMQSRFSSSFYPEKIPSNASHRGRCCARDIDLAEEDTDTRRRSRCNNHRKRIAVTVRRIPQLRERLPRTSITHQDQAIFFIRETRETRVRKFERRPDPMREASRFERESIAALFAPSFPFCRPAKGDGGEGRSYQSARGWEEGIMDRLLERARESTE